MKKALALLLGAVVLLGRAAGDAAHRLTFRGKRQSLAPPPLVYPFGGTLKLLFGCAIPIAMPGRILVYGQNFQFQFPLPQNASVFSDYLTARASPRQRRQADILDERAIFYRFLEHEVNRRGGPGKDCLKRSICEAAETPLRDEGLAGEMLHVLLTPDSGVEPEYREAAWLGRRGDDCSRAFPSCPRGFGVLDHISELLDYH